MACPWDSTLQTPLEFCEANLCAWIKEPANTWSNLSYLLVGLLILKDPHSKIRALLRWTGPVTLMIGITSALYHASGMAWAGVSDFLTMFLGTGAMTALNLHRWLKWHGARLYLVFFGTAFLLTFTMLVMPGTERLLYILAMPCCAIELRLFLKESGRTYYRDYLVAWLMIGLALLFWWLDISGKVCHPDNHWINGHAIWHVLTAVSIYFFYRYYRQFFRR